MKNVDWNPTVDDPVKIIHGDCVEMLPDLLSSGQIQSVITDPPYGIDVSLHDLDFTMKGGNRKRLRDSRIANDEDQSLSIFVTDLCISHSLPLCIFSSPYRPAPRMGFRNVLVWDKGASVGGGDPSMCWKRTFELIYIYGNGPLRCRRDESVLRYSVASGRDFSYHPCQKPVGLMRYLIRQLTDVEDVILDPCCGSGSTLVAAVSEGRRAIGIECDLNYVEVARRRMSRRILDERESLFSGPYS